MVHLCRRPSLLSFLVIALGGSCGGRADSVGPDGSFAEAAPADQTSAADTDSANAATADAEADANAAFVDENVPIANDGGSGAAEGGPRDSPVDAPMDAPVGAGETGVAPPDAGTICTPGQDWTCNEDPAISSLRGRCNPDGTCTCVTGSTRNPSTGRCK